MKIRIEENNGKKKYWVNDVAYDRIEDIPNEYQKHFVDSDNNGMPDQFDGLFGTNNELLKDFLKSTKEDFENISTVEEAASKSSSPFKTSTPIEDYSSSVEEVSIVPALVKIGLVILLVISGLWLYPQFVKSTPPLSSTESVKPPLLSEKVRLVVDDPNEPPYHMLGVVYEGDTKLFSFDLPAGAIGESSDSTMQISMTKPDGTNLNEATFSVLISNGACTMREEEFNSAEAAFSNITFTKGELEDSDEGHSDHTYRYSFAKNGRCFHFRLALHSANPNTYDPPVEVFDETGMIAKMETVLTSIKGH
jgi:hypothetical protein